MENQEHDEKEAAESLGQFEMRSEQQPLQVLESPVFREILSAACERRAYPKEVWWGSHVLYADEDKTLRGVANFLSDPASPCELSAAMSFLGQCRDPTVAEIALRCDWRIADLISAEQLRRHFQDFIDACNFGRRLKTLKGLAPTTSSANSGLQNRIDSSSIQSTKSGTEHLGEAVLCSRSGLLFMDANISMRFRCLR